MLANKENRSILNVRRKHYNGGCGIMGDASRKISRGQIIIGGLAVMVKS